MPMVVLVIHVPWPIGLCVFFEQTTKEKHAGTNDIVLLWTVLFPSGVEFDRRIVSDIDFCGCVWGKIFLFYLGIVLVLDLNVETKFCVCSEMAYQLRTIFNEFLDVLCGEIWVVNRFVQSC